jgi:hypothetical protein
MKFRFPSAQDIQAWCASGFDQQVTDETALRCARAVRRRSLWFTRSALVPAIVGLLLGALLRQTASKITDTQYRGLAIGLGVVVFVTILSWRDIIASTQPVAALQYYCSACIDRLRRYRPPTQSDAAYMCLILPKLEQVLIGRQLNHRAAGTREARRQVAVSQACLALRIGAAEGAWLASGRESRSDELESCLGHALVIAEFGWWWRLSSVELDKAAVTSTTQEVERSGFVAKLWDKAVDKGTETFMTALVGAIVSLAPVLWGAR